MDGTFAQRNPKTGLVEIIDVMTGAVVAVQRTPFPLLNGHQELMVEHTLPSGEKIRMQKGIDPGLLVHTQAEPFSQYLVDIICTLVAEGGSLTEICTRQGMPKYTTLCRWRRQHPHIQEQLDQARRDRAEYLRDQALKEAEGSTSRDPIGAHALRVDTYLKAASFDDAKYSPKAKIEANITAPTQIIVSTGITREVKEVTDDKTKEPLVATDTNRAGATARPETGINEKDTKQIHPVLIPATKPGNDIPG